MMMPFVFFFWFTILAYVVHVLDESLLGGSFVEKVQQHWWPEYSWTKFFWFNTAHFAIMIASVTTFDLRGGSWVVLPLAWVIERFGNACWHVWWAIHFKEYSPGLLTSILMFMNLYLLVRYWPGSVSTGKWTPRSLWEHWGRLSCASTSLQGRGFSDDKAQADGTQVHSTPAEFRCTFQL